MKKTAMTLLALTALTAGCRTPKDVPRDYDAVREHSGEAHGALDRQEGK